MECSTPSQWLKPYVDIETWQGTVNCDLNKPDINMDLPGTPYGLNELLWDDSNQLQKSNMSSTYPSEEICEDVFDSFSTTRYPNPQDVLGVPKHAFGERSHVPIQPELHAAALSPPSLRFRPSKKDWESYRSTIIRLYQDEGRSLKDVMQIMETRYGFTATVKMYKSRLSAWDVRKYMTHAEREAVCEILEANERSNEAVERIVVRGKERRRDIFLRHRGHSRRKHTGGHQNCRVGKQRESNNLDIGQRVIKAQQLSVTVPAKFNLGSLETTFEFVIKETSDLMLTLPVNRLSSYFNTLLATSCQRWKVNRFDDTRVLLNRAANWFYETIKASPARAVMSLFRINLRRHWNSYPDMFGLFYQHLYNIAQVICGSQSSVTVLLGKIWTLVLKDNLVSEALQPVLRVKIISLNGGEISEAARLQRILASCLRRSGEGDKAERVLADAMTCLINTPRDDTHNELSVLQELADTSGDFIRHHLDPKNFQQFRQGLYEAVGQFLEAMPDHKQLPGVVFVAFGLLAEKMGDLIEAFGYYQHLHEALMEELGPDNFRTLMVFDLVLNVLRKLGRHVEAAEALNVCQLSDEFSKTNL